MKKLSLGKYIILIFAQLLIILSLSTSAQASGYGLCSAATNNISENFVKVDPSKAKVELERINTFEASKGVKPEDQTTVWFKRDSSGNIVSSPVSVAIYHGLYNSPSFTRWLAEFLHNELDITVINVRLNNHYTARRRATDNFSAEQLIVNAENMSKIVSMTGERVVFIGHSVGGLPALHGLLHLGSKLNGYVGISSAFKVRPNQVRYGMFLSTFGISGWARDLKRNISDFIKGEKTFYDAIAARYLSTDAAGTSVKITEILAELLEQNSPSRQEVENSIDQNISLHERATKFMNRIIMRFKGESKAPNPSLIAEHLVELEKGSIGIETEKDKVIDSELNRQAYIEARSTYYEIPANQGVAHVKTASPENLNPFAGEISNLILDYVRSFIEK